MIEFIPGYYLYLTRIRTVYGLVSYTWLEFLPAVLALMFVEYVYGGIFVIAHWAFLGIYELGYIYNDRAKTAKERTTESRPQIHLYRWRGAICVRLATFSLAIGMVGVIGGQTQAVLFCALAAVLLLLLGLHTWIGSQCNRKDPRRWIIFSWLASFKYLPAAIACVPLADALGLCLFLFLSYGAGRVLEYALTKHGAHVERGPLDVNAAWFLATLPLALVTLSHTIAPMQAQGFFALVTLGSHHLAATLGRVNLSRRESKRES